MSNRARPEEEPLVRNLKALREKRGLTQAALAEAAGLTANGVWMIETGRTHPRQETLQRLADALDAPVAQLFDVPPRAIPEDALASFESLTGGIGIERASESELADLASFPWGGRPSGQALLYGLLAIRTARRE